MKINDLMTELNKLKETYGNIDVRYLHFSKDYNRDIERIITCIKFCPDKDEGFVEVS